MLHHSRNTVPGETNFWGREIRCATRLELGRSYLVTPQLRRMVLGATVLVSSGGPPGTGKNRPPGERCPHLHNRIPATWRVALSAHPRERPLCGPLAAPSLGSQVRRGSGHPRGEATADFGVPQRCQEEKRASAGHPNARR